MFELDKKHLGLALLMIGALPLTSYGIDNKFELEPAALVKKYPMPAPTAKAIPAVKQEKQDKQDKPAKQEKPEKQDKPEKLSGTVSYRVKRGDFLYKVLAREYGVTGERAEVVARRVKRANGLANVRRISVGTILLIPLDGPYSAKAKTRKARAAVAVEQGQQNAMIAFSAPIRREPVAAKSPVVDTVAEASRIWPQLVPNAPSGKTQTDYLSAAYSLSLDQKKYPILAAQDGTSILIDSNGSLPPLVKSLLQEKNPQLSIVSERIDTPRSFYRALLGAARFYSFEEDFLVDLGTDYKLTVHSDFKIEKSPDSLLRQDITLLKVTGDRPATPQALVRLLAANGFKVVETNSHNAPQRHAADNVLYLVPDRDPRGIADALLNAVGISYQRDRNIDLYADDNNGVRLEIPVHSYFEKNGERFAVVRFGGDPAGESLTRQMEAKGYQVIHLQDLDDLQSVSDKILPRVQISGSYGEQELWSLWEAGYGVRMAGIMVPGNSGKVFITDRKVDPLVQELARVNGYREAGK